MKRNSVKVFFAYVFAMLFALKSAVEIINTSALDDDVDGKILKLVGFKDGDN